MPLRTVAASREMSSAEMICSHCPLEWSCQLPLPGAMRSISNTARSKLSDLTLNLP